MKNILAATKPEIVYTHNPADKHDTHIGVVITTLQAMRELPRNQRPKKVVGCEVWRTFDWLPYAVMFSDCKRRSKSAGGGAKPFSGCCSNGSER